MSKKTNPESHQESKKSESSNKSVTIIIILCFLGIMPILIWASIPDSSSHTAASTASPMVESAAVAAGLQICSSENYPVNVPGGESAILYQLSPDCSVPTDATTVKVLVIGFTSTEAMNAAIATAQNTYQNWKTLNTAVFTSGSSVLIVQGAPGNEDVQQIGASLIEQGAVQVI
ncbi:MAG: hypothetical protein LUQ37_03475 [Methanoregulaceae archaeon]|jgi:hypothetical protein|nr:hypothetical protein [Methanoregulaceae archaeon]